jgi:hypothetical protein
MNIKHYKKIKNNKYNNIIKIINNINQKIKFYKCVIKYYNNQQIIIYKKYKIYNHKIYNNEYKIYKKLIIYHYKINNSLVEYKIYKNN